MMMMIYNLTKQQHSTTNSGANAIKYHQICNSNNSLENSDLWKINHKKLYNNYWHMHANNITY